ncbi:hypothetical protein PVC01_000135400 [Plasmodium vivax]|uniref:Uncharacterized protein n=1 Tax=Plasmodium vivax TaxID=5855 RepID=A0A1G4E4Q3_PLAVI|nr:hypothetical protein PVC01_000135400 [Plasmodium vivax]
MYLQYYVVNCTDVPSASVLFFKGLRSRLYYKKITVVCNALMYLQHHSMKCTGIPRVLLFEEYRLSWIVNGGDDIDVPGIDLTRGYEYPWGINEWLLGEEAIYRYNHMDDLGASANVNMETKG